MQDQSSKFQKTLNSVGFICYHDETVLMENG